MVQQERRRDDPKVKDGPLSEGLREAIEVSGISKYILARDAGISKPQFYRFLKGERDLSQKGLNSLATRLGVRVIPQGRPPDRTESRDSATPPAAGPEVGSDQARPDPTHSASRVLADLGAAIDEQFTDFESRLVGRLLVSGWNEPGVWDRLRGWFLPTSREDDGGPGTPPGDFSEVGGGQAERCIRPVPSADAAPTTPKGLLDALRISVKVRVHEAFVDLASGMRAGRDAIRGAILPPTATDAPGDSGVGTIPRHAAAPPRIAGGIATEDRQSVLGVPGRVPTADDASGSGLDADPDDLHAAIDHPGGMDVPGVSDGASGDEGEVQGDGEAADMGRPRDRRRRRTAPKIGLKPEPEEEEEPDAAPEDSEEEDEADGDDDADAYGDDEEDEEASTQGRSTYDDPDPDELEDLKEPAPDSFEARMAARRARREASPIYQRIKSMGLGTGRSKPAAPPEPEIEDDGSYGTNIPNVVSEVMGRPGPAPRDDYAGKIEYAMKGVTNPGMQELAAKFMRPKGGGTIEDKAKFLYFISHLKNHNPQAEKILGLRSLVSSYKDIAKSVKSYMDIATIANMITPSDLAATKDSGFYLRLKEILAQQGVYGGVIVVKGKKGKR